MKKVLHSGHDIFCANLYIPPIGTKYTSDGPYLEIQTEIFEKCNNLNYLIMFGDFNSRTGQIAAYTINDDFISGIQDDCILSNENMNVLFKLQECKLPLERRSADPTTYTYGLQMIDICKSSDLFILNGRLGQDRDQPKTTCKDRSTIDYFIASAYTIEHISNLVINELSSLFSDQHCGISVTLGATYQELDPADLDQSCSADPKIKLWDKDKAHHFNNNIDQSEFLRIKQLVDQCSENENVNKNYIDMITSDIENYSPIHEKRHLTLRRLKRGKQLQNLINLGLTMNAKAQETYTTKHVDSTIDLKLITIKICSKLLVKRIKGYYLKMLNASMQRK